MWKRYIQSTLNSRNDSIDDMVTKIQFNINYLA